VRSDDVIEVWIKESTLLSFDGRVLEVFGFADAHRFHIAFAPTISLGKRLLTIKPTQGGQQSFFYDQQRTPEIEAFAAAVHAAHA
jgi:hypothetical protein